MLTHEHRDHTSGLGEMRILVLNNKEAIPIHAGTRVLTCLRREFTYLFEKTLCQGIPNFELYPIENFPFDVEFLSVLPIQVYHGALPIWGFRMGKLTYITDAKVISEEEMTKIKGTTVLIVNALQREFHPAHFSLEEAVALSQRVNAKATYLTHISHHLGLHREISKKLPHDIHVAYDGLKISL